MAQMEDFDIFLPWFFLHQKKREKQKTDKFKLCWIYCLSRIKS